MRPTGFAEFELLLLTFCTGIQGKQPSRFKTLRYFGPSKEIQARPTCDPRLDRHQAVMSHCSPRLTQDTPNTTDAISFPDYHCFASNQTGNTVFLAVSIVVPEFNGDMFYTANIGVALGLFLAGGYLTGQLSHIVGPRLRLWLVLCNLAQTAMVFAAAALQLRYGVRHTGPRDLLVIALLAFASGSQVVQSRSLRMTEISTAMATAAWVDLLIDPHLLAVREKNRPRNRRLFFLVTLIVGSLAGAGIYKEAGSAVALFVSAGGKAVVTLMYFFNGAEKEKAERSAA